MIRFVAVGDLMVDVVASGEGHAARIATVPGGSALNAASWAAGLGADSAVTGRVGDDAAGRFLRSELELRGVGADISVDPEAPTGTVLAVDGQIRADRGANARFTPDHLPELEATVVLVSGHLPPATVSAALDRARASWIALDAARLTSLPQQAAVVLANEFTAERLTGRPAEEAVQLLARARRLACVTLGPRGAIVRGEDTRHTLPRREPPPVRHPAPETRSRQACWSRSPRELRSRTRWPPRAAAARSRRPVTPPPATLLDNGMAQTAAHTTWVGQGVARLEDDALLRGQGRYMDDLDPAPHAGHAAILRSPFAHARVKALDASAALELPGVIGVLTGADVARLSSPFPVGVPTHPPYFAAAHEVARYAGEPLAVVVARDRYVAEDALELFELDLEPLDAVADPDMGEVVSDRSFSYGDVDGAFDRAELVVSERFRTPRWSCNPVETCGVVADWNRAERTLTAWANFQGPFTLHTVAAGALGLPGSKLRLITPPDSGGSFGVKAPCSRTSSCSGSRRATSASRSGGRRTASSISPPAPRPPNAGRGSRRRSLGTVSCWHCATTRSRTWARTSARPSRRRCTGCTARCPGRTACPQSRHGTGWCSRIAARLG